MDTSQRAQLQSVIATLERLDSDSRGARAERVFWLSLHEPEPAGAIMGRTETMQILREARAAFIDGHFVSSLLLAMCFVEHTVVEELQLLGHIKGSPIFSSALKTAEMHRVFPTDWMKRAKTLSLRRNPFAHLKEASHEHGLGVRIRSEKRHPRTIMEDDAKDAIDLMYNVFTATLRSA